MNSRKYFCFACILIIFTVVFSACRSGTEEDNDGDSIGESDSEFGQMYIDLLGSDNIWILIGVEIKGTVSGQGLRTRIRTAVETLLVSNGWRWFGEDDDINRVSEHETFRENVIEKFRREWDSYWHDDGVEVWFTKGNYLTINVELQTMKPPNDYQYYKTDGTELYINYEQIDRLLVKLPPDVDVNEERMFIKAIKALYSGAIERY